MRLIKCKNPDEVSKEAAKIIAGQMALKPDSTIGFATGSTPVGTYKILIDMYKNGELDFSKITAFNLDEYYPIEHKNDQSYYYFMRDNLFSHVNIDPENCHIPNGEAKDADAECAEYDKLIQEKGGIDLQILGIGQNGHIGFNEPDENLFCATHKTKLTDNTIEANSRFFATKEEVPTHALTMGIGEIMKARRIILLATGKNKQQAVKALLNDYLNTNVPATMLKLHSDVVLICDEDALS